MYVCGVLRCVLLFGPLIVPHVTTTASRLCGLIQYAATGYDDPVDNNYEHLWDVATKEVKRGPYLLQEINSIPTL